MDNGIIQIWQNILKGDHSSWIQLVSRYTGMILSVAGKVGLDSMDAEDCAQYTWTALYRNRHRIKNPEKLPSWLILTARRQAIKIITRQNRFENLNESSNQIKYGRTPDQDLLELEFHNIIAESIDHLPLKCKLLMKALFVGEDTKSYRELAAELGISINTLGSLRARCLSKLSDILKNKGYLKH